MGALSIFTGNLILSTPHCFAISWGMRKTLDGAFFLLLHCSWHPRSLVCFFHSFLPGVNSSWKQRQTMSVKTSGHPTQGLSEGHRNSPWPLHLCLLGPGSPTGMARTMGKLREIWPKFLSCTCPAAHRAQNSRSKLYFFMPKRIACLMMKTS